MRSAFRAVLRSGFAVVVALSLPAAALSAQGADLGAGVGFERYTFDAPDEAGIESIQLLSAPFAARASLGGVATLEVVGAFAEGELVTADGSETTLSGLVDTSILLSFPIAGDRVTITGIGVMPTGESTQSEMEAVVAGIIAADVLPFRVSNWGTGGGVGMQVAATERFGGFGAGLSVAYTVAGEFEPLTDDQLQYQPGDELRVRLALDTEIGSGGKGSLVFGLQSYGEDRFDGSNLFQSGNRLEVLGVYSFPLGFRGSAAIYGSVLHREDGSFLQTTDQSPAQDLIMAGALLRRSFGWGWLNPKVDFRAFRSDDGLGQGWVGGAGLSAEFTAGSATFVPFVGGRLGNIEVRERRESALSGVDVSLTLRLGRTR